MSGFITSIDINSPFYAPSTHQAFQLVQPGSDTAFAAFPLLTEEEQNTLAEIPSEKIMGLTWQGAAVEEIRQKKNKLIFSQALTRSKEIPFGEYRSNLTQVSDIVLPILQTIATRLSENGMGEQIEYIALRHWDNQMYKQSNTDASSWHRDYMNPGLCRRRVLVTLVGETTQCLVLQHEKDKEKTSLLFGRLNEETSQEERDLNEIVESLLESKEQAHILHPQKGHGLVFFAGQEGAIHRIPPQTSVNSKRIVAIFDCTVRYHRQIEDKTSISSMKFDLDKLTREMASTV